MRNIFLGDLTNVLFEVMGIYRIVNDCPELSKPFHGVRPKFNLKFSGTD